jgi:diguanylate cyclase (GGDEF)-like protein
MDDAEHDDHADGRNERDRLAHDRDATASGHEQAAVARDQRAADRDSRATAREQFVIAVDPGAKSDRAEAVRDRQSAASDRAHAASDRNAAASDRLVSARDRSVSSIDGLTGAHRRDAGTVELERELARSQRTGQSLVLAFVDVVGLKVRNDELGHDAGDRLLRSVVEAMRANLRSYDLIVRFGGDEFVCGLVDLSLEEAALRFSLVSADLAEVEAASITVGLVERRPDEPLHSLIARGDDDLYRQRRRSPGTEPTR